MLILTICAGLIAGPNDLSDCFTCWPWRSTQDGPLLAPGWPDRLIQWVDVCDG